MYSKKGRNKYLVATGILCVLGLVGLFLAWGYPPVNPASAALVSNINSTNKWAWNDIMGWIDFYNAGGGAYVTSEKLKQFAVLATSPTNYISLDCATAPPTGDNYICASSTFSVSNDGNGNLAGYAWNDDYGWISFCGNATSGSSQVGDHWECPVSPTYRVLIDVIGTGDFSGYAWNDVVGWISFNDSPNYKVSMVGSPPPPLPGYLESSTFDTGAGDGFIINSITWKGTEPANTSVKFQIAVFDVEGNMVFKGPGGSQALGYETGVAIGGVYRVSIDSVYHHPYETNYRYFRYRVFIDNGYQQTGPVVEDVIINWSS